MPIHYFSQESALKNRFWLTDVVNCDNFNHIKSADGEFLHRMPSKRARVWCERAWFFADCRPGADSPNAVGEYGNARYSV